MFLYSELFFPHVVVLAGNFNILLGKIEITVPSVKDGDDYQIVCEYLSVQSLLNHILNQSTSVR